jgi:hypothetical protein
LFHIFFFVKDATPSKEIKILGKSLKGPKLEIFGSGVFTQIRPVWVGDLGTRVVDPDPYSIGSLDPDPDPYSEYGSGSRRAKMTQKSRQ